MWWQNAVFTFYNEGKKKKTLLTVKTCILHVLLFIRHENNNSTLLQILMSYVWVSKSPAQNCRTQAAAARNADHWTLGVAEECDSSSLP